ncbi:metal ABC transporter substrate-binding protein [Candidatus Kaiserbacteria bacterium]|nr:metal ABC transporter substrate-binding protein [Candidatus Kaiserbacteria bacterium]
MNRNLLIGAVVVLVALLIIGLNNRNQDPQVESLVTDVSKSEKPVVLSTFTIIADMVREVGGDKIESVSLTKPGAEIHGYQPTPSDLIRAQAATIIFENGMNLELWTEKLKSAIPDVPVVRVSEGVEVINITRDAYEGKPNPHAWMSPAQGLVYVENIRKALTEVAPEHGDYFAARAKAYSAQIQELDERLEAALATLPEDNRALVTCEGAFAYLAKDYGLDEIYLWATNSDAQGTPQQVTEVIEEVKQRHIPSVFCESTVEPRLQNEVADATDAKLGGLLYVDSLSEEGGPATSYLALLEHTTNTIIAGLIKN